MLKSVIKFMFDNIGNLCTTKKIADSMTSAGRKISNHTVENYLEGMTDSLLMYRVGRYDIKGKEYLQLQDKYYLADIGLRYYLLGMRNVDQGHILENVVYLELASLDSIADHNPKYLLTMDNDPPTSHNGIRQVFVLDWLLN